MKKTSFTIWLTLVLSIFAWMIESCKKNDVKQYNSPLTIGIPQGFPPIADNYGNYPITQEGFDLGRKLFYDGRLSSDGMVSCASCHEQYAGFVSNDHNLSHGVNNQHSTRNTPGLANLAWYSNFHWDGGVEQLEAEPLTHITLPNEMGETVENVLQKLRQDEDYRKKFKAAFGNEDINEKRMLMALTQFTLMMVSANSKYDQVKNGTNSFTAAEQRGYDLFVQKCGSCHREPLFTDQSFRNTGLPIDAELNDYGRMVITGNRQDSLKFRVPTLRNIYVTQPYNHDGRFFSLGAVIDHYRSSVINGPTTDPLLKNKIAISDFEKLDLLVFLRTLTDTAFLSDKRFASPQ